MCAYLVCEHKVAALEALKLFEGIYTAKYVKDPLATYALEVIDYLEALEFAMKKGWYDYKKFDASGYLHFNSFNNGDINWIVPDFMLAFSGPADDTKACAPANTPQLSLQKLKECGVNTVIRLNEEDYDKQFFLNNNMDHVDIIFADGTVPDQNKINMFYYTVQSRQKPFAVHCKAGLGRTGTLIVLYLWKFLGMTRRAAIAWTRMCRPGSIQVSEQEDFLLASEPFPSYSTTRESGEHAPQLTAQHRRDSVEEVHIGDLTIIQKQQYQIETTAPHVTAKASPSFVAAVPNIPQELKPPQQLVEQQARSRSPSVMQTMIPNPVLPVDPRQHRMSTGELAPQPVSTVPLMFQPPSASKQIIQHSNNQLNVQPHVVGYGSVQSSPMQSPAIQKRQDFVHDQQYYSPQHAHTAYLQQQPHVNAAYTTNQGQHPVQFYSPATYGHLPANQVQRQAPVSGYMPHSPQPQEYANRPSVYSNEQHQAGGYQQDASAAQRQAADNRSLLSSPFGKSSMLLPGSRPVASTSFNNGFNQTTAAAGDGQMKSTTQQDISNYITQARSTSVNPKMSADQAYLFNTASYTPDIDEVPQDGGLLSQARLARRETRPTASKNRMLNHTDVNIRTDDLDRSYGNNPLNASFNNVRVDRTSTTQYNGRANYLLAPRDNATNRVARPSGDIAGNVLSGTYQQAGSQTQRAGYLRQPETGARYY